MIGCAARPLARAVSPGSTSAVDRPFFGQLLYRLNVNRLVVRMTGRGHVYADPGWLNGSRLDEKLAVTRAVGARHASVRFVAGELDPLRNRAEFLALTERITGPILVLHGAGTPPKSKASSWRAAGWLIRQRVRVASAASIAVHAPPFRIPDYVTTGAKEMSEALRIDRQCSSGDGSEATDEAESRIDQSPIRKTWMIPNGRVLLEYRPRFVPVP